MIAIDFNEQNAVWGRPENMTAVECGSLPAHNHSMGIISCWQLTPEEIEKVRQTGIIWVDVMTRQMPPISLSVDSYFE